MATTGRFRSLTPRIANIRKPKLIDAEERGSRLRGVAACQRCRRRSDLDYDTLNPHFEYIDEDSNKRHVVWFLDAVTALNELRGARELGLQTFALGAWAKKTAPSGTSGTSPATRMRCTRSSTLQPGHDIDTEGDGDIIRVTGLPKNGKRTVEIDTRRARSAQEAHHR